MKQQRTLLISLIILLMFGVTSFAAPLEHEGSLEFYWDKDSQLTHSEWAKLTYDLRKDFGYGYSAGLSVSISPDNEGGVLTNEWDGWANMDFDHTHVSLGSWKEFTAANLIMADGNKLRGGPGATIDFKQVDNLALQAHIGNYWDDAKNDWDGGMIYTYGAKATYDAHDYQAGLGLQGHKPEHDDLLLGGFVFGSTELAEGLTLGAEAGYRTDLEDWHYDAEWDYWYIDEYHSGLAVTAQVDYNKDTLSASALAAYKDSFFLMKDWDEPSMARDYFFMSEWDGILLAFDLEEEVIPYLTLKGSVDVLLNAEDPRHATNASRVDEIAPFGFAIDASYRATLGSTVSGWYSQYDDSKLVGVGFDTWDWALKGEYNFGDETISAEATYTFADGFDGSVKVNKPLNGDIWYGLELKIAL